MLLIIKDRTTKFQAQNIYTGKNNIKRTYIVTQNTLINFLRLFFNINFNLLDLGLADRNTIPDDRFTASSSTSESHPPWEARLNGADSWCVPRSESSRWLQIDLGSSEQITGVETQGSPTTNSYVKAFQLQYGLSPSDSMPVYQESGSTKVRRR